MVPNWGHFGHHGQNGQDPEHRTFTRTRERTLVLGRFVDPLSGCRGIDHGMSDGDFQKEFCSHPKRYLAKAISYRECRKNDINENAEFNNDGISDYRLVYISHLYDSHTMSQYLVSDSM